MLDTQGTHAPHKSVHVDTPPDDVLSFAVPNAASRNVKIHVATSCPKKWTQNQFTTCVNPVTAPTDREWSRSDNCKQGDKPNNFQNNVNLQKDVSARLHTNSTVGKQIF